MAQTAVDLELLGADEGGFVAVYERHHGDLERLAFLLTSHRETAADVTQDAFVALHRRWHSVRDPIAYLRRAVVNGANSELRRRYRRQRLRLPVPAPEELGADEMTDALRSLPPRQRAAIVLRFYHDLSEARIADVLGCRPGTVGSLIHRGLAQLREVIEP